MNKKRVMHILCTCIFIAVIDIVILLPLYNTLLNREDGGLLSKILFAFICIFVLSVSAFELIVSAAIDYDETGIYAYRTFGKAVFCSWESITKVELQNIPRHGESIIIYNNDRFLTPANLFFKPKSNEAVMMRKNRKFMVLLKNKRPDIEIDYNV